MPGSWSPPRDWTRVTALDVHAAGEPLRILTGGLPSIPGKTILDKRRHAMAHLDDLRTALLWEPRGHADMYGAILTEPATDDGDAGVLFLHNEGFSTMCGHGIIGMAMAGVHAGVVPAGSRPEKPPPLNPAGPLEEDASELRLDTPAGRVVARTHREEGRIVYASFLNVPSFVYALDQEVEVKGLGPVAFDVAFGGAFYAFCQAEELGLALEPEGIGSLIDAGRRIKAAVEASLPIRHPFQPDLGFLYGTVFIGDAREPDHHSRNVCIFAEGEVDRSPTGTGVSARAALHHARGELEVGEAFTVESILGTTFTGEVVETTDFGPHRAVVPRISGTSYVTGRNELLLDPTDPLRGGFLLR